MTKDNGPVLIELEDINGGVTPATAPVVPDLTPDIPQGQAIQTMAVLATRRPSVLWRLFWAAALGLLLTALSVAAWDFVFGLLGRNIWLGRAVLAGLGLFVFAGLGLAFREWIALARLRRVDRLQDDVAQAVQSGELVAAKGILGQLTRFYRGREDLRWALENLATQQDEILDADALLDVAERELMSPLDAAARREVEAAARQVAMVTAIVPLALADVVTALASNLKMVRRIAEIYGGRAGTFGSWRLLKGVMLHLVATGAVAVGDDLISSIAGGGLLSKLSRRFGEGVVNGALTARVGVAAMEVCRPMPFRALKRPKVAVLVSSALKGLFSKT